MKNIIRYLIIFVFILFSDLLSQTNLDIYQKLISQSIKQIDSLVSEKVVNLEIILPSSYLSLKPYIINSFSNNGFIITDNSNSNFLIYSLNDLSVDYQNLESKNFFGDDKLIRKVSIGGQLIYISNNVLNNSFSIKQNYVDTIKLSDLEYFENKLYPFTQGKIPEQPLLKNLIQPVIIVGVLISTVILFFTVRSK
ncbi:hypothetical protein [Rosettibacter firmus]|uniref:hypothetical protein n=1 Tax=Rosettibacter firmus TaxID=3111522 RepID=UPI00336BF89A